MAYIAICYIYIDIIITISYIIPMKDIAYSKDALKALRKYRGKVAVAIVAKIEAYRDGEKVDIKTMKGTNLKRIRVGDFRVILNENDEVISIIQIGPRGDVYK